MITNRQGRPVPVDLPATIDELAPEATTAEYARLARLNEGFSEQRDAVTRLEGELERAETDRSAGIKAAALAGKPLPVKDPTKGIREHLELARSRVEGFADAVSEQEHVCVEAVSADGDELMARATARRDAAAAELAKSLDVFLEARSAFVSALADVAWLHRFPQSNAWDMNPGVSVVLDAHIADGGFVAFEAIETALRKDADPVERLRVAPRFSLGGGYMPVPARDEDGHAQYGPLAPARAQVGNR